MTAIDRKIDALEAQVAADQNRADRIANQLMLGTAVNVVAIVPLEVANCIPTPMAAAACVLALLPLAWCTPRYMACHRRMADALRQVAALHGQKSDAMRLGGEVAG